MIRKIIQIDEKKCNGCGACAEACHEGAIGMVNGKAKLLEYSCAMKSHFRKFGNQMSGSGNHLCKYTSLLA